MNYLTFLLEHFPTILGLKGLIFPCLFVGMAKYKNVPDGQFELSLLKTFDGGYAAVTEYPENRFTLVNGAVCHSELDVYAVTHGAEAAKNLQALLVIEAASQVHFTD